MRTSSRLSTTGGSFELHLKAGVTLDHEADDQFDVTVQVDDASVGGAPDATQSFSLLSVTDENEAPTAVSLDNQVTSIAENYGYHLIDEGRRHLSH